MNEKDVEFIFGEMHLGVEWLEFSNESCLFP